MIDSPPRRKIRTEHRHFGLYSISPEPNPLSLRPTQSEKLTIGNKDQTFSTYHNKDSKENYYSVKLLQDWQVRAGKKPESYSVNFPDGHVTVELMDVPDKTTLELYVLSQEEPRLKSSLNGYKQTDYRRMHVNNNESYQLTYTSETNGETYQTIRTYFSGQDNASVITLSAKQKEYTSMHSLFASEIMKNIDCNRLRRSSGSFLPIGDCKVKSGTSSYFGLHPDLPTVTLHDLLADGKSYARARILFSIVQTLEDNKNTLSLPWINSYPCVLD
jgi:hypothetical protein